MEGVFHLVLAVLAFVFIMPYQAFSAPSERYLIKFKKSVKNYQVVQILDSPGMIIREYFREINVYSVDMQSTSEVLSLKKKALSEIAYMEKDHLVHAIGKVTPKTIPHDAQFNNQTEYHRTSVQDAWDTTQGSRNIVVAVSDTGVDMNHPDLRNNIWTNPGEIPDNGVDDDHNGFVDDVHGWDFVKQNNNPIDENNHGTHVSGIIGAEGNNDVGIAGINWQVSIMPVRFLDRNGSGYTSDGIATILYAARNGARIVNCSWGGDEASQALRDAIQYSYSRGTLVVAAAGNSAQNLDTYPSYPGGLSAAGVVSVGSSSGAGELSDFSNYGLFGTLIAAPGSNILSSIRNEKWGRMSGTSMASPMVAGVAALILSVAPNLNILGLRNAILNSTDDREEYRDLIATSGDLNAQKAITQLSAGFQVWPSRISLKTNSMFQFYPYGATGRVAWTVSPTTAGQIDGQGTFTPLAIGNATITATDSNGATASTIRISIEEMTKEARGCPQANAARKLTPPEITGSVINYGLPLLLMAIITRRRIKKKKVSQS
jgi:subtilisin family serine protease